MIYFFNQKQTVFAVSSASEIEEKNVDKLKINHDNKSNLLSNSHNPQHENRLPLTPMIGRGGGQENNHILQICETTVQELTMANQKTQKNNKTIFLFFCKVTKSMTQKKCGLRGGHRVNSLLRTSFMFFFNPKISSNN